MGSWLKAEADWLRRQVDFILRFQFWLQRVIVRKCVQIRLAYDKMNTIYYMGDEGG